MEKQLPKKPLQFGVFLSKPHIGWVIGALLAVFFATALDKISVIALQNLTNTVATQPIDYNQMWLWGILFPVIFFAGSNMWRVSGFTGLKWFMGLRATGYQTLYEYLSLHSKDYFNSRFAGALANKISNAVEGLSGLFEKILWRFLQLFLAIVFYSLIAGFNNWILGAIIFVWSVFFIAINFWFAKKLNPYSFKAAETMSTLKGKLVDSLSNISLVHEYAYVKGERDYIKKYVRKEYDASVASWTYSEWVLVANGFLVFIFAILMLASTMYLFQAGLISIGVIVVVVAIVGDMSGQLFFIGQEMRDATRLYGQVQEGLDEILKEHNITNAPESSNIKIENGQILIENISFEYGETPVFENFSLEIPAGQKIGIVGRSGAGKTTFVSLLLRHYDVGSGEIKIDGHNIQKITLESLRKSIAFVPQDTSLFHRTIEENIRYSNPGATGEDVTKAAKAALADGFIKKLPQGYKTLVGERGVKLSGGQRQRIAIARAFLKNAPILILDEATSSLDSESEQLIQKSLEKLMNARTVIAIAHRLSTLKEMDRLVVIENGKIVEDGKPDDLLKIKNGIFKNMWDHQVKGFIVDE